MFEQIFYCHKTNSWCLALRFEFVCLNYYGYWELPYNYDNMLTLNRI